MAGVCDDLRVIDLSSGAAGGIATMVLADFGADVIKVEPPGGDPARAEAAAPMWLRGKRSVTLDLDTAEGREHLHRLVAGADVAVSSYAPGPATVGSEQNVAARHGADHETLRALNPALVYCSITGWGPRGPYAGYPADERVVAAKCGRMQAFSGVVQRDGPSFTAVQTATHAAAQSAVFGTLAALWARESTGEGQVVETSLLQGTLPYDLGALLRAQLVSRYPDLQNDRFASLTAQSMPTLGYQPVMAGDGRWIQFANLLEHLFIASIEALDLTADILGNPRYSGVPRLADPEATEEVRNMMLERARERPAAEWMERFRANGNVAADFVGTAQEALANPDLLANEEVVEVEHPELGTMRQLGVLARLTETPGRVAPPSHPAGADTDAVLAEPPRARFAPAATAPRRPVHPLEGVTVLEFATIIAAPLGASVLADLGARVIKVEPVGGGDPMRTMGVGLGAYFITAKTTAGKESICIDLKSEEGQRILRGLLERADVIVHNYRPDVPERLGIGYEQVKAIRPDILWVSVNGYGPHGPNAVQPAAHPVPGAVCGGALMQAGSDWPGEVDSLERLREASRRFFRANEANPDPNTSMVIASSVLLGLRARQRFGTGQRIYVSMLGANAYANFDDFAAYEGKPPRPQVDAEIRGTEAAYRLYRAADGWVFLSARSDEEWRRFCAAAGRDDLAQRPEFATREQRRERDAALGAELDRLFAARAALEWERALIPAGVACVEASTAGPGAFLAEEEHAIVNGFAPEAEHAVWGEHRRWGATVTFSDTPTRCRAGVLAGQHTDAILEELGRDADAIRALHEAGVVFAEDRAAAPQPATV